MRQILLSTAKILVSSALLYLALRKVDLSELVSRLGFDGAGWIALAVAMTLLQVLTSALRWREISSDCGAPLTVARAVRYCMIGSFFNQTLPSSIGGDAMRLWLVGQGPAGWRAAAYSIFVDRAIGLIALAFTGLARNQADWARPGRFMLVVLAAFTIYALSNEVYAGPLHLLHWRVPEFLMPAFETFRSSGRFFWPVSYALVLYTVARFTHLGRIARIGLAAAVLVVQAADLQPIFAGFKQSLKREANEPADIAQWNAALAGVSTIHAFPKFKCNGALIREILPLQMIAARGGYNLTTGFISRYGADCDAIAPEIAESDPATSAYVFTRAQFSDEQIRSYAPAGALCRQLDIWIVCRKGQP